MMIALPGRRALAVAGIAALTGCGSAGGPRASAPTTADLITRVQVDVLDRVLRRSDLIDPEDGIVAVCVGMGERGSAPPSASVLRSLVEVHPAVRAAALCQRTGTPGPGLSIGTTDGQPALLLGVVDEPVPGGREIHVYVEKTGAETRTLRCSVAYLARRREIGRPAPPPPPPTFQPWRVSGC